MYHAVHVPQSMLMQHASSLDHRACIPIYTPSRCSGYLRQTAQPIFNPKGQKEEASPICLCTWVDSMPQLFAGLWLVSLATRRMYVRRSSPQSKDFFQIQLRPSSLRVPRDGLCFSSDAAPLSTESNIQSSYRFQATTPLVPPSLGCLSPLSHLMKGIHTDLTHIHATDATSSHIPTPRGPISPNQHNLPSHKATITANNSKR